MDSIPPRKKVAPAPATEGIDGTQRSIAQRVAGAQSLMQGGATFASSSVESMAPWPTDLNETMRHT